MTVTALLSLRINAKVAVLGAGVSGLSFAYFLSKLRPDVNITIYEKNTRAGGWICTEPQPLIGGYFEKGPRTLRGVRPGTLLIVDILRRLGLSDQIEVIPKTSTVNKKYLLYDGQLVQTPDSVGSTLKFLETGILKGVPLNVLREPFRPKPKIDQDESIESFIKRRFGNTRLVDNMLSAILYGIYSGDASKLSVRSIFPQMAKLEQDHGSLLTGLYKTRKSTNDPESPVDPETVVLHNYEGLIAPDAALDGLKQQLSAHSMLKLKDGLQVLTNALASYLEGVPSVTIKYGQEITSVDAKDLTITTSQEGESKFDHIRSTINTNSLAKLIGQDMFNLDYVTVFLVNVYSKSTTLINKHGFGFLVPRSTKNPEMLLGMINDSDIEQNSIELFGDSKPEKATEFRNFYNKVTFMFGGPHYLKEIPSESIRLWLVKESLAKYLGIDFSNHRLIILKPGEQLKGPIADSDIVISYALHQNCIPQYNVGYEDKKRDVTGWLQEISGGRFSLGGMAFAKQVGVPDCVFNGLEDALTVSGEK